MQFIRKSIPKKRIVHGIKIEKLSLGDFLDMIETLRTLPQDLLLRIFPDMSFADAISELKLLRHDNIFDIFSRTVTVLPAEFVSIFSILLNVPQKTLKDSLTPSQFMDVIIAFCEINDIQNFIKKAKGALIALKNLYQFQI